MGYSETAQLYADAGWPVPFPLPAGHKHPPPEGVTGQHGRDYELETALYVAPDFPMNYGLRMPEGVMGLDVDQYGEKKGADLLARLEAEHGALPAGPWSSSRTWPSGIRFFRIPVDAAGHSVRLRDKIPGGIEIIQRHHRYAVVWPSVVEGREYHWCGEGADSALLPDAEQIPCVWTLDPLPEAWLAFLSEGASDGTGPAAAPEAVAELEDALFAREGVCPEVAGLLADADARMAEAAEGGRHDTMTGLAFRAAHLTVEGHLSWRSIARHLGGLWDEFVGPDTERQHEFERIMRTALSKVGPDVAAADPCSIMPAPGGLDAVLDAVPAEPVARAEYVRRIGGGHSGLILMAHRFAAEHAGRLLHVHGIGWHAYDGRRWVPDTGEVYRAVHVSVRTALVDSADLEEDDRKRLLGAAAKVDAGTEKMLRHAAARPELACLASDLDADPYLLNLANGTLDLRSVTMREHDPRDRCTKIGEAAFDPDAPGTGAWARFLARVLPDPEVRAFLQRVVGMALLGEVREHVLPILTGTGRNGKGVFYTALLHALGGYAETADPEMLLERFGSAHPTGQMILRGARFVVTSENDRNRHLAEATMKRLTGGDRIRARLMHKDFVEFDPSHTVVMVTNHLPQVSGDDPAVWARMRVVPFDVVIPDAEQDPGLGERLRTESSGEVIAWAVAGWLLYRRDGLSAPAAVRTAGDEYREASDPTGRWLRDCCVLDPHDPAGCTTTEAHLSYLAWWAEEMGLSEKPFSLQQLGAELDRRGVPGSKSNGRKVRRGLSLKQLAYGS